MTMLPFPSPASAPDGDRSRDRELAREALTLLFLRPVLLVGVQLGAVLLASTAGSASPWSDAHAWWPLAAVFAGVVGLVALQAHTGRHGVSALALVRPDRRHLRDDLPVAVGLLGLGLAGLFAPARPLAEVLLGDPDLALAARVGAPAPPAVLVGLTVLPVVTALVELPTLLGYVLPRLARVTRRGPDVVPAVAMALALQQAAFPLAMSWPAAAWQVLSALPFALVLTATVSWRPRLLPWVSLVHGVLVAAPFVALLRA